MLRAAALLLALALAACGGDAPPAAEAPRGVVAAVLDARTLALDDGAQIRLAGVNAPQAAQGGAVAEPLFEEARGALEAAALGRTPKLVYAEGDEIRDRWDRRVARVEVDVIGGQGWLQARLIEDGLARVDPEEASRPWDEELLAREAAARAVGRGMWAEPFYAVRAPEAVDSAIGSFQIVEGVVVDAAQVRGTVYLNFGPDWRTDFTASVPPEHVARFAEADLLSLSGARVGVRGFVTLRNGPMIVLRERAQLERLD